MRHHGNKIVRTTDCKCKNFSLNAKDKSNDEPLACDRDALRETLFDRMQQRSIDKLKAAFTLKEAAHG
jgi:hypothetical protein